jgi:hypothetical protein
LANQPDPVVATCLKRNDETEQFLRDGYVFVPNLLVPEEAQILVDAAHADAKMLGSAIVPADTGCTYSSFRLESCRRRSFGLIARPPRVVDRMEAFLGGDVYHYYSKMIFKPSRNLSSGEAGSGIKTMDIGVRMMPLSRHGKLPDCH